MSLLGVIGVVLIILKLAGLISISWALVLLPLYIIPVIWIGVAILGMCAVACGSRSSRQRRRW